MRAGYSNVVSLSCTLPILDGDSGVSSLGLDKFAVPAEERLQVLGFIGSLRQDIVE